MSNPAEDPIDSVWQDVGESVVEPPSWLVKGFVPKGLTFFNGPPKSYKSAGLMAAICTILGVPHSVLPPDLCESGEAADDDDTVMGLSLEATAGVLRHTAKVGFGVDVPSGRLLIVDDPFMFRLDSPSNMAELLTWLSRVKPKLFFVDPLRNAHSLDENDSSGMVGMMQPLQRWAMLNNAAVIVNHHSKKLEDEKGNGRTARASDMRGSSALFGLADGVITFTKKSVGVVHLDAVFKRGEPWERTVQLGIWGAIPTEQIDSLTKTVFEKLAAGKTREEAAAEMHQSKMRITLSMKQLERIGAITAAGVPTAAGRVVVENAVRRFGEQR